jgi:hypothetical protein
MNPVYDLLIDVGIEKLEEEMVVDCGGIKPYNPIEP